MIPKLKRDQIPQKEAQSWRKNFLDEEKLTFDLKVPQILLHKETYKKLAGENENRVRIYLGLENEKEDGKNVLVAFAVSAFLLGSGDVYVDYETPVYKLGKENIDYSSNTDEVIECIKRYRAWRNGDGDSKDDLTVIRQYIYPVAFLLTKYELHEIFNAQSKNEAQIEFGITKKMSAMIVPGSKLDRTTDDEDEVFNYSQPCPPHCDERSIYNS